MQNNEEKLSIRQTTIQPKKTKWKEERWLQATESRQKTCSKALYQCQFGPI